MGLVVTIGLAVGAHLFGAGIVPKDITASTGLTATDVANALVGPGVQISNITFKGDPRALGIFTDDSGAIGFGGGVVLSTGKMADIIGPNSTGTKSTNLGSTPQGGCLDRAHNTFTLGLEGDDALDALSGFITCDATVLELDFIPDKDRIFLQYVFGSEEYNEFVNKRVSGSLFNDVFAFWVNDVNCATIDAAHQVPVSINTINGGGPILGQAPISHAELFVNNDFRVGAPRNTQMDGLTVVLTCQAAVMKDQPNHLRLAIADATDPNQDSNVFLRAGSLTTTPPLTIVTMTNGTDNDLTPGPYILTGPLVVSPVTWTYHVKNNTFTETFTNLVVTDTKGVAVSCPGTTLSPGASMICTANGTAVEGQYENFGRVTGTSTILGAVTDSNVDHYFGARPGIAVITKTNFTNNDFDEGPSIQVGTPVNWTYEVTNTGNVPLTALTVTDSIGVAVSCSLLPGGPPKTTLEVATTLTCIANGLAIPEDYENLGSATGTPPGGLANVTATNVDHYFGADPRLTLSKTTNGTSGPAILVGDEVVWTYTVTNTGNVDLTDVVITDDTITLGPPCTIGTLEAGAIGTCTATGVAQAGQHTNIGNVTGHYGPVIVDGTDDTITVTVMATDDDGYFGANPAMSVVKKTGTTEANATDNTGLPAPVILVGDPVVWAYTVTNTGNVALTNVIVSDDQIVVGPECAMGILAAGATRTCVATAAAQRGEHTNIGTATGKVDVVAVTGPKTVSVSHSDDDSYFGAAPEVALVKKTGTTEANATNNNGGSPPVILVGDPVVWTFTVTNTGNVPLTDVTVTDDMISLGPECTIGALEAGASRTCAVAGVALRDQHTNTATVTSKADVLTVDGPRTVVKTASDADFYFGAAPEIAIVKKTGTTEANATDNTGHPAPVILVGDQVVWTYTVTNTGNVPLTDVAVTDNTIPLGPDCTIGSLAAGASRTCAATALAQRDQHTNIGTATGKAEVLTVTGSRIIIKTASDDDAYFGAAPEVAIVKKTGTTEANASDNNGGPGPVILIGEPVVWTYTVTNTGNVPLSDVTVTDDKVTLGPECAIGPLAAGASRTCTAAGIAERDHHTNTATVTSKADVLTVTGPRALVKTASDEDGYFGAAPDIAIIKKTGTTEANATDNTGGPAPAILVGEPVVWTYTVTNTGNVPLTDVAVSDDTMTLGPDCTIGSLAAGAIRTCTATAIAQRDQHVNIGTATGKAEVLTATGSRTITKTATDDDAYFGAAPQIAIVKKTGTTEANARDTKVGANPQVILAGDQVVWTYTVTNTGNVALADVTVTDDKVILGSQCSMGSLAAGASRTCSATGVALRDLRTNIGTATGAADVLTATGRRNVIKTASDEDMYFGAAPEIAIVKKTGTSAANATNNDSVPGVFILVNDPTTSDDHGGDNDRGKIDDCEVPTAKKKEQGTPKHSVPPATPPVVTWTYTVTNTGNVPLTDVAVSDDKVGGICTVGFLAVGDSKSCTKTSVARTGPYENTATATANATVATVAGVKKVTRIATDVDHYFGVTPGIKIVKKTNGTDNNGNKNNDNNGSKGYTSQGRSGPVVAIGSPVVWTYEVTNTGNVTLTNVSVTDSDPSLIVTCPRTMLPARPDPASAMVCSATGKAVKGQYTNIGTARGTFAGPIFVKGVALETVNVSDADVDHYVGVKQGAGFMTGGGSVFTANGIRVTHGGKVNCDVNAAPNNLEINWGQGNNFHMKTLTSVMCIDDPGIQPNPPDASFDTLIGTGTGLYNKKPATISFRMTDAGEPGTGDTFSFTIMQGATVVQSVSDGSVLMHGNQQAHSH